MVQVHWIWIYGGFQKNQREWDLLILSDVEVNKLIYLIIWNFPFAIAQCQEVGWCAVFVFLDKLVDSTLEKLLDWVSAATCNMKTCPMTMAFKWTSSR